MKGYTKQKHSLISDLQNGVFFGNPVHLILQKIKFEANKPRNERLKVRGGHRNLCNFHSKMA